MKMVGPLTCVTVLTIIINISKNCLPTIANGGIWKMGMSVVTEG